MEADGLKEPCEQIAGTTLVVKELDLSHVEQYNNLLRYVFQITNSELESIGWQDFEMVKEKEPALKRASSLGWFDGDKLISQVSVYPLKVNIHGKLFDMGGVTGVGTYPEYSGHGLVKGIMLKSLQQMKEAGQTISYLFPYSIPYYRKKGWEIISDVMSFSIKDTQLPEKVEVQGLVQRLEVDHDDVKIVYDLFARKNHGAMIRGQLDWGEYFRWDKEEMVAAVYYDINKEPTGFLFYWVENDKFYLKEMIYLTQEARHGLWNFVSAHFSMVDEVKGRTYRNSPIAFLLEDSEITETIKPYIMARIVDVPAFLKMYPFKDVAGSFHFVLHDPLLEFNNGVFSLVFDTDGNVAVGSEKIGKAVEMDINTLTTMLMSYKRPRYLKEIGRIQADDDMIRILERIIPTESAYFSDFF